MPDIKEFYNLDFDVLKEQFKSFISSQTEFQDYNFEGAALSQLLDVITFGIQYQQTYLNMATNELFLDTAQIEANVFKLANTLNYIPKRKGAAYLFANIARINVVSNGEIWTGAGDPYLPDDWAAASGTVGGTISLEDASADPGAHAGATEVIQIVQDTAGKKEITQAVTTTPGVNYTFTMRHKASIGQNLELLIGWTDLGGENVNQSIPNAVPGTWDLHTVNFMATNNTTYITIGGDGDVVGSTVAFDETRLTQNVSATINKYTTFEMGSLFLTNVEDIIISDNEVHQVRLYEGTLEQENFLSQGEAFQEYQLAYRDEIDNDNLNVYNDAPNGSGGFNLSSEPWINVNTEAFELNDPGYYVQHFEEFSVKFDDGQRFQIPASSSQVRVIYLKTTGADANGKSQDIFINSGFSVSNLVTVNATTVLQNGTDAEDIDAIRLNAPLYYTTQNRAVTQDDHNILVKRYTEFDTFFDAFLWGGELEFVDEVPVTPATIPATFYKRIVEFHPSKEFPFLDVGHVYCTALKNDFAYLNQVEIDDLIAFLNKTRIIALFFRFLHPQIVHIAPTVNIKHESILNLNFVDIATQIDTWLNTNLEGFNKIFHLSNLINFVDDIDEVVETDITYTSRVTVRNTGYVAVRLWNAIVPGSINGMVNGFALTDTPIDSETGDLFWNGFNVGSCSYTEPATPALTGLSGGFLIINQDDSAGDFGLAEGDTYDLDFEYADLRTVELNRETFMQFDPIILNAEIFTETR